MALAENGQWELGWELYRIAAIAQSKRPYQAAAAVLEALAKQTSETALLTVYDPRRRARMFVAASPSRHSVRFVPELFTWMPAYAGASATALLAFRPKAEQEAVYATAGAFSALAAAPDAGDLKAALQEIRERGYAISHDEVNLGASAVAAPVRSSSGAITSSVAVIAPNQRFDSASQEAVIKSVIEVANAVGRHIAIPRASRSRLIDTTGRGRPPYSHRTPPETTILVTQHPPVPTRSPSWLRARVSLFGNEAAAAACWTPPTRLSSPGRRQVHDVLADHQACRPALRARPRGQPAADHAPAPAQAGRLGAHPHRGVRPQPLGAEASAGSERRGQFSPGAWHRGRRHRRRGPGRQRADSRAEGRRDDGRHGTHLRRRLCRVHVGAAVPGHPRRHRPALGGAWRPAGSLSNQWTVRDFSPNEYLPRGVRLAGYFGDAADLPWEDFQEILDAVAAGRLAFPVDRVYDGLEQVSQAHDDMEHDRATGKLVVRVRH